MRKLLVLFTLFISVLSLSAQDRIVKGVVVDETNAPVPGAHVVVQGTKVGTMTDIDGKFTVKIPVNGKAITVSFMGYNAETMPIGSKSELRFKMVPSTVSLKDVVVVGFGTQNKATMTGSVSTINAKDLLKSPTPNMATALIGRTPGLTTYQKSGQPGADGITLRIRGVETTNNADPLVLVDGVERDFTQLDPNEIESFSILKDAASTAVFGIRGANGVMIVTTKKGVEGPAKINFTSNLSVQQPTRMPKLIDAESFCRMYNEALINDNATAKPYFTEDAINKFASGTNRLEYPNTDWMKEVMKPYAIQQQHNLTISGGTKTTKYYTSFGYFNQEGLMYDFTKDIVNRQLDNNYTYDRINLRSNIDVDVTSTTKIGVQIGGIIARTQDPGFNWTTLLSTSPISGPIVYDGKLVNATNGVPIGSPLVNAVGSSLNNKNQNSLAITLNFNQKLDFITKGLVLRGMTSYDSYYIHNLNRGQGLISYTIVYLPGADGNVGPQLKPSGEQYLVTSSESFSRNRKTHNELALEYKHSFGKHNVTALALATFDKKWYTTNSSNDIYYTIPMGYEGFVSRLTYDYNSKYLFEVNMGYNGSENFPADKRFALFPAFSIGWNVAEEKFVKELISPDIMDKFKIRGSYGIVGNDATAGGLRFLYLAGEYKSGGGAVFGDATQASQAGFLEGKQGNPKATWETAAKQNLGVELALFKNSLTLNADVFQSDRKNILALITTFPAHVAFTPDYYNVGRIKNKGFEVEGKWRKDYKNFSYFIGGNYSFARNKIIETSEPQDPDNPQTWRQGTRLGQNFGFVSNGFYNSLDEIQQGPVYGMPGVGEIRYTDVNGDGVITSKDQIPIGNPEFPEINYGVNMGCGYKGFDFSVLFQGATNTSKIMTGKFQKPFDVNGGILDFTVAERWTPENAANAQRPRLTLNYANPTSYLPSTTWLRDGSYLRLRNMEIAYRFNTTGLKKAIGITGLRVYANGQNLFTWDKLKVVDPEADTNDSWKYPQLRVYNIGAQVSF